jgi:hypothetical protein
MGQYSDILPPKEFKSDGCSGGLSWIWKKLSGKPPVFEDCCFQHDQLYHWGGNWKDRLYADWELLKCVWNFGKLYKPLSVIIFIAVRLFGNPIIKFGWNWGYGWGS